jgi:glutamine amidotransferase
MGIGNFLYTDGELLIAYSHKRHQTDGNIRPPGLHFLCRRCTEESNVGIEAKGLSVYSEDRDQLVVLIASVPLTNEGWEPLGTGEILTVAAGQILSRTKPLVGG